MLTLKDRRHSGRQTVFADDPDYPTQITWYDEWNSYKDGLRLGLGHYGYCGGKCTKCQEKQRRILKQKKLREAKRNSRV